MYPLGSDNVGNIASDGNRYYYIKDHLGSIRAVVNESYDVVSAQDYDAWGNVMENRSYGSESKYKFTGKERDKNIENNYDYGACPALAAGEQGTMTAG